MRPQVVLFPFLGMEMGGSHISAYTLAGALTADFGVRCVVLAVENSLVANEAARLGLEVAFTGDPPRARQNPFYDLVRTRHRAGVLRRFGPNAVLHCNDLGALQSWGLAAKLTGTPAVYHHRAFNRMIPPNTTLVRLADHVICISQECRAAVDFLPAERASIITNPFSLDIDQDRSTLRRDFLAEQELPPDARLVGFVGNFWRRKRPRFFLEVCAELAQRHGDLNFVLFGRDGEILKGELETYAAELGIGQRTRFPGFRLPVEHNIAVLDALLLTAVREPFGRTGVEGLLLGVPYVATADAGHLEIASRWGGGVLVDPAATAGQFAEKVDEVLSRPADVALTREQRVADAASLTPRGHAEAVMAVYDRVLK